MKILTSILIILCVAVGTIFSSILQSFGSEDQYEVRVINGFTNNSSLPLVIWCTSSMEDEIGGRALQEGDDFGWSVRTSFWGPSGNSFFCTMKWDQKRKKFEAFKVSRDVHRCGLYRMCSWLVKEDGFYFSNDEVNWVRDFSWS
ncbi:hypothetical protein HS088_TW01G00361 [Tripterygium wilfordii]|uniref:S-protein homolog n=1 Tax=Tripterygium wilfordii TaxID=458696 RepID=A0A7J7E1A0_TRIWF|nr:S-protein homolog 6 [Tripterygium wilfordii]KAF5752452.1 hypothetical protein HS088_TW01G00361 [Tripterygium wilfordii]